MKAIHVQENRNVACLESMLDNRIKHLRAFELLLSAAEVPLLLFSVKGGQGP